VQLCSDVVCAIVTVHISAKASILKLLEDFCVKTIKLMCSDYVFKKTIIHVVDGQMKRAQGVAIIIVHKIAFNLVCVSCLVVRPNAIFCTCSTNSSLMAPRALSLALFLLRTLRYVALTVP